MVIRRMVTGDPGDLAHFAEAVGPEHSLAPVAMPVRCRRRERELATTAIDGPHDFSGPIAWVDQNYRLGGKFLIAPFPDRPWRSPLTKDGTLGIRPEAPVAICRCARGPCSLASRVVLCSLAGCPARLFPA